MFVVINCLLCSPVLHVCVIACLSALTPVSVS